MKVANEKRLIDVLAEIRKIQEVLAEHQAQADSLAYRVFESVKTALEQAPTVDAVEVVHGRWEKAEYYGWIRCDKCKDVYIEEGCLGNGKWNYCPHCGAKMDGGNEDVV